MIRPLIGIGLSGALAVLAVGPAAATHGGVHGADASSWAIALPDCGVPPGSEPCEIWSSRYDNGGPDVARASVLSPDGSRLYQAGASATGTQTDFFAAALDTATGVRVWTARYGGTGTDQANAVVVSSDGLRVFVTGQVNPGVEVDYGTVAYDAATGTRLWEATYAGSASGEDWSQAIAVGRDGERVYVTGYVGASGTKKLVGTVAYEAATGRELWVDLHGDPDRSSQGLGIAVAEVVDDDGRPHDRVYVVASNSDPKVKNAFDITTLAFDGATGGKLWEADYDSPAHGADHPHAMALSSDGSRLFVTGKSGVDGAYDYLTIARATDTGDLLWASRYDGGYAGDQAHSIAVAPSGDHVYVTGISTNSGNASLATLDESAATVAYDASTGAQTWVARRTSLGGESAIGVAVAPDGERVFATGLAGGMAFVVGSSDVLWASSGYNSFLTVAYRSGTGEEIWVAHYLDPGYGWTASVSPDSKTLYVAGGGADAVTLAYEA